MEPQHPQVHLVNKWRPIGLGIASIVTYAVGGGLIGDSFFYDAYGILWRKNGEYFTGLTLCTIGSFLFIAFIVISILYCVRRSHAHHVGGGGVVVNNSVSYNSNAPQQNVPMYQQPPMAKPEPVISQTQIPSQNGGLFCGNCGSPAQGRFCAGCGAPVQGQ